MHHTLYNAGFSSYTVGYWSWSSGGTDGQLEARDDFLIYFRESE